MASTRKSPPSNTLRARVAAALGRHVRRGDRLVAGVSGGIDSVVMLDLLRRAATRMGFELAALHVNHQINPAAAKWARFCRDYCRQLGVPLTVVKVNVPREASLEAAARKARYAAFAALPADFIVLAHNLDDQAETMLLQLLRGAGVKGLSAMPEIRLRRSGAGLCLAGTGLDIKEQAPGRSPATQGKLTQIAPRGPIRSQGEPGRRSHASREWRGSTVTSSSDPLG